ncbi:MAG: hypothetical protein N2C12_00250 [Planctomycetales bacterium]
MKEFECDASNDQQIAIDRMVDGELDGQDQSQLLASLDDSPDGWRRLALAFVEDKLIRNEMQCVVSEQPQDRLNTTDLKRPPQTSRRSMFALAVAGSFLLAFMASLVWQMRTDRAEINQEVTAKEVPQQTVLAGKTETDTGNESARHQLVDSPVKMEANNRVINKGFDRPKHRSALHALVNKASVNDASTEIHLPVSSWSGRFDSGSALPGYVVESLENYGFQVNSHKDFQNILLPGGQRVVIPIEQVDVLYKGLKPYQ